MSRILKIKGKIGIISFVGFIIVGGKNWGVVGISNKVISLKVDLVFLIV